MKKFCVVLTALALMCALCACGGQSAPVNEPNDPPAQTNSQPKTDDQQAPDNSKENDAPDAPTEPSDSEPAPEEGEAAPGEEESPAESGGTDQPEEAVRTAPVQTQPVEAPPALEPAPEEAHAAPVEEPAAPAEKPAADPKATAANLVGRPVSELYAAIGQPVSSDYAPSCLVEGGEDGELTYNGFTVYTVKDASGETVYDVF